MCGIIGVAKHPEAAKVAYLGLYALQHRGEEAAGIASFDGKKVHIIKNTGLIEDAIEEKALRDLKGDVAIGHCRYSTTGSSNLINIQPFLVTHRGKAFAIAHNGNLTNTEELYHKLEEGGSIFQTTMDSEIVVHMLAKYRNQDPKKWFIDVLTQLKGSYAMVFLVQDQIFGARDPQGFRPLCLGKLNGSYILASETCSLDLIHAEFLREIEPGEVVFIDGDKIESEFIPGAKEQRKAHCIFENIYFARPDSDIFNDNVYQVRRRLGEQLAKECPAKNVDFVMAIPDSGNYAALGYARQLGVPLEVGMIRNHYVGRTFIQPTQVLRDFRVRVKLNPIRSVLNGKRIVVVDDSIVRGTTARNRVEVLRKAGAKEVHMRIACPPIKWPCFYGIDFPSQDELIAYNHTIKEIADFIKVDSLEYLSLEGLLACMKRPGDFCHACFSGEYPVDVPATQSKYLLENNLNRA